VALRVAHLQVPMFTDPVGDFAWVDPQREASGQVGLDFSDIQTTCSSGCVDNWVNL
jgi:hypothetical protein